MAKIKFCNGTKEQIDAKAISDGTMYVATDTGDLSVDLGTQRISLNAQPEAIATDIIQGFLDDYMSAG